MKVSQVTLVHIRAHQNLFPSCYCDMYTVSYLNPAMDFDMDSDEDEDDDGEEAESLAEKAKEIMHSKVATIICLCYVMIVVSLVIV